MHSAAQLVSLHDYLYPIGCSLTDLTPNNAVRQSVDREFVNTLPIPSGVVCYNRTTPGSEAVYICEDGFHQDGAATRVCQSGGAWNGSIPQRLPDQVLKHAYWTA